MDILDENFGAQTAPVELTDLVGTELPALSVPKASMRNRAATAAMLTDQPEKAVENYQLLMREAESGQDAVYSQVKDSILNSTKKVDMQGIMSVLADPKVSFDEKKKIVEGVKGSQFLSDSGTILHTNSLAAGSKGENPDQENARLSSADAIREIYNSRNQVQGLVNAHGATLEDVSAKTAAEMAELWVMPFGNNINSAKMREGFRKEMGRDPTLWETAKSLLLPGSDTAAMRREWESLPPEKRVARVQSLLNTIKSNSGVLFSNDNQFAQQQKADQIFGQGGYSTTEEWLDNASTLLDVFGLGQTIRISKGVTKTPKAAATERALPAEGELVDDRVKSPTNPFAARIGTPPAQLDVVDTIKRIESNSIVHKENPAAPAKILQQSNPEKARAVHDTVVKSTTDEVAEALYGTSKEQAIISDKFPQVTTESGRVTSKVVDIDRNLRAELDISEEMMSVLHDTGATYFTPAEKAAVRKSIKIRDFDAAGGLVTESAESGLSIVGGRVKIDALYGTSEGGFTTAKDAMDQAGFALRNTGVAPSDITLMVKSGLDYVPTTLEQAAGKEGSYKVRVSGYSEISPSEVFNWDKVDVKRNWLDSLSSTMSNDKGSASRWIFDAASMVHPVYSGPAVVATDAVSRMEKILLGQAAEFSDEYMRFGKGRKAKIDDYIREANYNGIKFDPLALSARGFTPEEIGALHSWKKYWDGNYYLENYDIVRTLNAQGYQKFKNSNVELFAKPVPKNQNLGQIYDTATDSIVIHGKGEGDMLYATGGTYAKLRRPTDINGTVVEHMVVYNTPSSYLRKFRETDEVLNYRDGYFQLQYKKNAKFVDEVATDGTRRTVAVAGDTLEATAFAERMSRTTGIEHKVRGDVRGLRREGDEWWDLNSASGRIAQRHRGKLLEDASGLNHLGDGSYILNPVDSAVRAAKSIAGRTVTRPMLESAKARFIAQRGDLLPSNNMGGKAWPKNLEEITAKGEFTSKDLRAARTEYEFINFLENGYINSMDEVYKQGFNAIAHALGRASLSSRSYPMISAAAAKAERGALKATDISPSGELKSGVYLLYIVSNVLRQWIVQPHQSMRMVAINPTGFANGGIIKLAAGYLGTIAEIPGFTKAIGSVFEKLGGVTKIKTPYLDHDAFAKFVQSSGLLDSVDKSNLVRGTLLEAADSTNPITRNISKYLTVPARKAGFDLGETINLLMHSAAVYERRMRKGGDLSDLTQRDEAYSEIRALSGDMNFAGDMPYNQTLPSVFMQFIQVGHKMMTQATNRRITVPDRMRLVALDWIMWGSPVAGVAAWLGKDILPDDPIEREAIVWGLESAMLNKVLSQINERPVSIDFSSLAPYNVSDFKEFAVDFLTGGPAQALANSPAGQLFMKDGGRVRTALSHLARYFGVIDEMDEDPETALQVAKEVAKVLSGVHNLTKAQMILDTGKTWNASGKVTAEGLGVTEAVAQVFGFATSTPRDMYESIHENNKDLKKHKERVTQDIKAIMAYYTSALSTDNANPEWITKVSSKVLKVYEHDPVAQDIINSEIEKQLKDKDSTLVDLMIKRLDIPSPGATRDRIKRLPIDDEKKQQLLQIADDIENARAQYETKE